MNKVRFNKVPSNFTTENPVAGYVLIMMVALIPVLLLGTKYVLDLRTVNKVPTEEGNQEWHKHCAKEAALAVARNWNPGLTFEQQKAAVYKVADAVYSASPFTNGSAIRRAIPGLDVKKSQIDNQSNGSANPMKVIQNIEEVPDNPIKYNYVARYRNKNSFCNNSATWNPNYKLWRAIDQSVSNLSNRHSEYDEINKVELKKGNFVLKHHDICKSPSIATLPAVGELCAQINGKYYPNNANYSYNSDLSNYTTDELADTAGNTPSIPEDDEIDFTKRQTAFGDGPVRVSLENDQIKVETDADSGKNYPGTTATAVPAQCNVDIVLAIPVNGAASNEKNRDAASDVAGNPVNSTNNQNIQDTPIYQMGQACKDFVKKFYHTRGVTMGLIPYSAKVSLDPAVATNYTAAIPSFVEPEFNPQVMIGACLYATNGEKDQKLAQDSYNWGIDLTGCPIMSRFGVLSTESRYGDGNYIAQGNLISANDPRNSAIQGKYRRMNLCPCYGGYANMLSMRCERECAHYLPNPYYMIEPTADLVKIYEMCNALYPFYDTKNVSNFLFIPFEWARNFFQSWTNDPGKSQIDGRLTLPSKTSTNPERKKVFILLVNKPDWFEPGELTYLGFDNDISEIPMVESDKIDFSVNYGTTSYKFLDGTNYNTSPNKNSDGTPLIAGPKKILKIEKVSGKNLTYNTETGYYEAKGTYRLKFPRKGQIELKVAQPQRYDDPSITFCGDNIIDAKNSIYNIRRDSTSGTNISLGSAETITGLKKFVFSGGNMPAGGSRCWWAGGSDSSTTSNGRNFRHNLSVKKVRYLLNNAQIVDCVLKNQILRDYMGTYNGSRVLIMNNGTPAVQKAGECNHYYTYDSPSKSGYVTIGSLEDSYISKFMDSCIKYVQKNNISRYYWALGNGHSGYIDLYNLFYVQVYGVTPRFNIIMGSANSPGSAVSCYYQGQYSQIASGLGEFGWYWGYVGSCDDASDMGNASILLQFHKKDSPETAYASSSVNQFFIQNTIPKELVKDSNNNPIIVTTDPIQYTDLIQNKGIYLAECSGPSGIENWICFQGDGQLEVTVSPLEAYARIGDSKTMITSTSQTITVPSSAFTKEHGKWVATVHFCNAYVKSLTQNAGTRIVDTIDSELKASLVYCYENYDGTDTLKFVGELKYDESKGKYSADLPFGSVPKFAATPTNPPVTQGQIQAIEFTVDKANSSDGNMSCYYKENMEQKTISGREVFRVLRREMQNDEDGTCFVEFNMSNVNLDDAKFFYELELNALYEMNRTEILDWRKSPVSTLGTDVLLSGCSQYNYATGSWTLNTANCSPKIEKSSFASDISTILGTDSSMFAKIYMPDYEYNEDTTADIYIFGPLVRLFSPLTRDSKRKFHEMSPFSYPDYDDKAVIKAHSFTIPYNSVLVSNGYQEANDTPTQAAAKATADVCSELKKEHGNNLRIYVIEYRKQLGYKTFPGNETRSFVTDSAYKTIEDCADYWYEINSKEDLEDRLGRIASEIKDFAGYTDAKAANVEQ